MPTDFSAFKKVEGVPALTAAAPSRVAVVVKLRKGAARPSYVEPRAQFGPDMFSAEIEPNQLPRLNDDPAVASISLSQPLARID